MIFFFKHFGKLTFAIAAIVVSAIILHMVNEEEAQHFNSLWEENALALNMRLDSLANLYASHHVFGHFALRIAFIEHHAVEQLYHAGTPVDAFHHIVVAILCHLSALFVKVEALAHQTRSLPHIARIADDVVGNACLRILALAHHYLIKIEETIGGGTSHLAYAFHLYFLHQLLVVGINRIKAIHHVQHLTVCGRIEQHRQWIEELDSLSGGVVGIDTEHALRLVDNHHRIGLCQNVDRATTAKLVTLREDNTGSGITTASFLIFILVER